MKKYLLLIFLIVFTAGCAEKQIIGGDKDEYGCYIAAGYSWCEPKQKCIRIWEEGCPEKREFECIKDEECIPLPSDCHPTICINKNYEDDYKKPEFCTEVFMLEAAYIPEDCICKENNCFDKNKGRQR